MKEILHKKRLCEEGPLPDETISSQQETASFLAVTYSNRAFK